METEVWIRNPIFYIRECFDLGVTNLVFEEGLLKKKRIDINRWMTLYYGHNRPWRAMIIGDGGAKLVEPHTTSLNPSAVFPVWNYGDGLEQLIEYLDHPVGLDEEACKDPNMPDQYRPRLGQAHYVILNSLPSMKWTASRQFMVTLSELQEEYPDAFMHTHALYGYRPMFGFEIRSTDAECRHLAAKGKVILPTGRQLPFDDPELEENKHWVSLFGFKLPELRLPRNRCLYNIQSAMWAGQHFRENIKFRYKGFEKYDEENPFTKPTNRIFVRRVRPLDNDKFYCNTCSLSSSCKYYREGAVCAVPDSEPADLVTFFGSRDSDKIMSGLSELLKMEAQRVRDARNAEIENEDISPETTKMINNLFGHAEKMAKLVDPNLKPASGGPTINNFTIEAGMTPQELTAKIVDYLVDRGMKREEITSELVMSIMQAPGHDIPAKMIEAGRS